SASPRDGPPGRLRASADGGVGCSCSVPSSAAIAWSVSPRGAVGRWMVGIIASAESRSPRAGHPGTLTPFAVPSPLPLGRPAGVAAGAAAGGAGGHVLATRAARRPVRGGGGGHEDAGRGPPAPAERGPGPLPGRGEGPGDAAEAAAPDAVPAGGGRTAGG